MQQSLSSQRNEQSLKLLTSLTITNKNVKTFLSGAIEYFIYTYCVKSNIISAFANIKKKQIKDSLKKELLKRNCFTFKNSFEYFMVADVLQ